MPRRILVIQGHPDPDPARYCRALAAAYAEGARAAGHPVKELDIARLEIPVLRLAKDFTEGDVPDSLKAASQAIVEADHLVFVFPLWLGTMPALLKAFLEQVIRPRLHPKPGEPAVPPNKLLAGRSARVVVTMGMPAFVYRFFFFAHGIRGLERNILRFVGIKPVRETLYGMVEMVGPERRAAWIDRMRDMGRRGV